MRALALLALFLVAESAAAQVTISGHATIDGQVSMAPPVPVDEPPEPPATPCDLPLSFAGTQGTDCMRTIFKAGVWDRRGGVSYGVDPGEQKLTTDCNLQGCGNIPAPGPHSAAVFRGNSPPVTAWIVALDPGGAHTALYGDGTTCTEWIDAEVQGEGCGGVAVLITEGANQTSGSCGGGNDGGAYIFVGCEGKGTDTARLERINLCTGGRTSLATTSLNAGIDVYGGTIPPANCDHNRGQADWHMNCQWSQVCLTISQSGGNISFEGKVWRIGKNAGWAKGDPENNDPGPPSGTTAYTRYQIGSTLSHGPISRASNINATGYIGLAGVAASGSVQEAGLTNFRFTAP